MFIIGIGWTLKDGYPHEMRAADYDDWVTETRSEDGHVRHGLNGDILVWNPVTKRRHELTSMGIRVNAESLKKQLELTNQIALPELPVSQGNCESRDSAEHWRRHRAVAHADAAAAQGASRRSERHRVAEGAEGYVREEEHPCAELEQLSVVCCQL